MRRAVTRLLPIPVALVLGLLAPLAAAEPAYRVETVATGLAHPWSMAWLPDGTLLVTERPGRLRRIGADGLDATPIAGVPPVYARSQGGLFDVLPHPAFADNRLLYLSFAHGDSEGSTTRVVRGRLDGAVLRDVEVVWSAEPMRASPVHYGGRMAWLDDGTLLVTTGDGYAWREDTQRLDNHLGKTVRLNSDGSAAADNPFVDRDGALPEVWTYGHRSPQGLAVDRATGRVWQHEHGAQGGDELNLLAAGANFGWPVVTTGIDYTGARISPFTTHPGMVDAVHDWVPSIAPSGLAWYSGAAFPAWAGDLFLGALVDRTVVRIDLDAAGQVQAVEDVFPEVGARIRDVREGPDGFLYVSTDAPDGRIVRIRPAG